MSSVASNLTIEAGNSGAIFTLAGGTQLTVGGNEVLREWGGPAGRLEQDGGAHTIIGDLQLGRHVGLLTF